VGLEWPAEDVGVAIVYFALKLLNLKPPLIGNRQWWETLGVSADSIKGESSPMLTPHHYPMRCVLLGP
jgi:hypothetical protein